MIPILSLERRAQNNFKFHAQHSILPLNYGVQLIIHKHVPCDYNVAWYSLISFAWLHLVVISLISLSVENLESFFSRVLMWEFRMQFSSDTTSKCMQLYSFRLLVSWLAIWTQTWETHQDPNNNECNRCNLIKTFQSLPLKHTFCCQKVTNNGRFSSVFWGQIMMTHTLCCPAYTL